MNIDTFYEGTNSFYETNTVVIQCPTSIYDKEEEIYEKIITQLSPELIAQYKKYKDSEEFKNVNLLKHIKDHPSDFRFKDLFNIYYLLFREPGNSKIREAKYEILKYIFLTKKSIDAYLIILTSTEKTLKAYKNLGEIYECS